MKKYAVEARIYDNGYIDAFIRGAKKDEVDYSHNLERYDLYGDEEGCRGGDNPPRR